MFRECIQQFFKLAPVVLAFCGVQLVPLLVTRAVSDQVPRLVVQGAMGAVFKARVECPCGFGRDGEALVRVRQRAVKTFERVGDFGGVGQVP